MNTPETPRRPEGVHTFPGSQWPALRPAALVSASRRITAALLGLSAVALLAQSPATTPEATKSANDEPVKLSPFEVRAEPTGIYQVTEALSGGRLRTDLFESSASISIITPELMADIAPRDIFSAAKYLAGIANNSSQIAGDRVSIRGFQVSNPDIDGFATPQSVVKQDPALYERIEFVRGPDALLAPSGSPGGTLNLISKTANFKNAANITAQVGQYDTNSASFDLNRVVNPKVAFRVVGTGFDDEQGDNQGFHHSYAIMPSLLLKLSENTQWLFHFTYVNGEAYNYLGFPIDPAVGASSDLKMLPGLNVRQSSYADNEDDRTSANYTNRIIYRTLFTSRISDNLSVRVAARYIHENERNNQWNLLGNAGGGRNPLTGEWTPGLVWSSSAPFVSSPAPAVSPNYSLSQSPNDLHNDQVDFQNDYVYEYANKSLASETVAGVAAQAFHQKITGYSATSPAIDIYHIPAPATWTMGANPVTNQNITGNYAQVYVSEKLKLWNERLILNGSVVPTWFYQNVKNYLSGLSVTNHPQETFFNYGLTLKATEYAALYFGHSESAAQIVNAPTASNPNPPQLQGGEQYEVGLRFKALEGRATFNIAYYDLKQTNNTVVNPALFSVPPPTVTPPPILADRTAQGWEAELNVALSKELSFIASGTIYENRSPYNVRFRMDPEKAAAVFLNYRFLDGAAKGLALGFGYTWQGSAAGESVSGVTNASTTTNQIPNLPSFYVPSYGLLSLNAAYSFEKHWTVRLYLDNALDETYYAGSLNRNAVMPGIPRNFRTVVTYAF